ncbi:hypothetical protein [Kribbia dieselivorans]|uniref:hypothetical protein n=1 Tax=Kribbia dieselivorans TaxID=331526 RepID=UPI0012ED9E62|nr:hypothetical protein [Kribbia dieselivorans]
MDVWGEYDRWNTELAVRYFGEAWEGVPRYLEPQEDLLRDAASALGLTAANPLASLVAAVRPTLQLGDRGSATLARHRSRFQTWRRTLRETPTAPDGSEGVSAPPVVALLVVLVAAATRMGADDTEAAHAYYPRLNQLLGLDSAEAARLKTAFTVTESFWRGVNEYLEAHEGNLGLPTAYALGHRYVGLPQSQALIRAGDRAKLPDFFDSFGLTPGSQLVPSDLERLLDSWIGTVPTPVSNNLANLWRRGSARERICGIASVELAHWDGTRRSGSASSRPRNGINLTLVLRKTFGGRTAELSFVTTPRGAVDGRVLRVMSAEGQPEVGVVPAPGGRLRPMPGSKLDPESLTGALVEVEDPADGSILKRRPRRVVVLRRDELVGAWTEVERIQLMEDFVVLVADDDRLVSMVSDVVATHGSVDGQYGGPHDTKRESIRGLPNGWVMLENVRLHSVPKDAKDLDLQPLIPLTTAHMAFARGLKLPGRIRKWSSLEPPEIRAAVAEAELITVKLWELGDDRTLLDQWQEHAQALVAPLKGQDFADGDYEVELYADDDKEPLSASTLRLRSGDSPDLMSWEACERLNYELDTNGMGALSAVQATGHSEVLVDGVNTIGASDRDPGSQSLPGRPRWTTRSRESSVPPPPIVLGTADPTSCVMTGRHRIALPTFMGKAEGKVINGTCVQCGLQKTYPAKPRRQRAAARPGAPQTPLTIVAPAAKPTDVSWDSCLDALVHVGGGAMPALERIATQAEGSSLFVDEFVRTLEVLGHIDVSRDSRLQPEAWEGNPAYLAQIPSGEFLLAGVWSAADRKQLGNLVAAEGGSLTERRSVGDHITSWFVHGLTVREAEATASRMDAVYVVGDAADLMMRVLPTLGVLQQNLPSAAIPEYRSAEIFDLTTASWRPIPGLAVSGAYRLSQSFRKAHIWVDESGAVKRQGRLATVQLVKHLAARAAGHPLTAYLPDSSTFLVPLGADLPALYGRALTLCSGHPPAISPRQRVVAYREVPPKVAQHMQHLLSN